MRTQKNTRASLKFPLLLINLKTYKESSGSKAVAIAKACERATRETGASICIAVQAIDLQHVANKTKTPVIAQHVDAFEYGKHTGAIVPQRIIELGGKGTLLNHSEKKLTFTALKETISECKNAGLLTVVCASTTNEARKISTLQPNAILLEQPELIAGSISVATANPELIMNAIRAINANNTHQNGNAQTHIPLLCGAGINSAEDIKRALQLGCKGVALSNAVCNAENPAKTIMELARAMKTKRKKR